MKTPLHYSALIFFIILFGLTKNAFAEHNNYIIKLAILDNPNIVSDNSVLSSKLYEAYMQGIATGVRAAKKKGYTVQYKTFFYGNNILDIIKKIPEVELWNPDVIIGLHNSNQFLITRNYLSNVEVISLYASDPSLRSMKDNFYSLGVPDQDTVDKIPRFIVEKLQIKDIFLAVQVDNKADNDYADLLKKIIQDRYPNLKIIETDFFQDSLDSLNMKEFLASYKKGDVIVVLSDPYYTCTKLMSKISKYLSPYKPVFLTPTDNWGSEETNQADLFYFSGYRITPYLITPNTKEYKLFLGEFLNQNHIKPENQVSYTTYNAIMSFVEALYQYPAPRKLDMRERILWSFQKALSEDPNWFRPKKTYVYLMHPNGEQLLK